MFSFKGFTTKPANMTNEKAPDKSAPPKKQRISIDELSATFLPKGIIYDEDPVCGEELVFQGIALGDIAGTRYEGMAEHYRPDDPLWSSQLLSITGNTILADAVMTGTRKLFCDGIEDRRQMKNLYGNIMRRAFKSNPDAGYERSFERWAAGEMRPEEAKLYQARDGASAVRSMCIGAMMDEPEEVIKYAMMSAMPTHAHPDGIKGAVVTAMCVYLASHSASKKSILQYASTHYPGDSRHIGACIPLQNLEIGEDGCETDKCSYVVPAAIACFIGSEDFEGTVRNALSIPGDACLIASIAGGLAAAYYTETVEDADMIMHQYGVDEI